MGIQNRDYYRADSSSGGWSMPTGRSMCQNILISTAIVFLFQMLITVPVPNVRALITSAPPAEREQLLEMYEQNKIEELNAIAIKFNYISRYAPLLNTWGALEPYKVVEGQVWRLVTYAFLHDTSTPWHIVFNMMVLWMFGPPIEERLGRREFLAFYLVAAIVAGLVHLAFGFAMRDPTGAVGASGAMMGIMMLFTIYYPHTPISIFFVLTLEARWVMLLYLIYDALPILRALGGAGARSDGIAHAAHLGGLLFGFLYYKFGWRLTGWLPQRGGPSLGQRFSRWWTRPALRVYQSPVERPPENVPARPVQQFQSPRDLEHQVDLILKKIKDEGEASLTDDERNLLRDASRAYKNRNT
ncbi:MAG: rhomboid family intramembrane serine protease [Planctomycetota bacterium]